MSSRKRSLRQPICVYPADDAPISPQHSRTEDVIPTPREAMRRVNCQDYRFHREETYPSIRTQEPRCDPNKTQAIALLANSLVADGCGRPFDIEKDDVLFLWQQSPPKNTLGFYGVGSPSHQPESAMFNQVLMASLDKARGSTMRSSRRSQPRLPKKKPLARNSVSGQICQPLILNRQVLQKEIQQMPIVQRRLHPSTALEMIFCTAPHDPYDPFGVAQKEEVMVSTVKALGMERRPKKRPHGLRRVQWYCPVDCDGVQNACTQYEWAKYKIDPRPYNTEFRQWLLEQKEIKSPEPKDYDQLYERFLNCFESKPSPDPLCKIYEKCCMPKKPRGDDGHGGGHGYGDGGGGGGVGGGDGDGDGGGDGDGTENNKDKKDKNKDKIKDKNDENNNDKDKAKDMDRDKDRDKDKDKDKDQDKDKDKDKDKGNDKDKDKDRNKDKDKKKNKNKNKDKDMNKDNDKDKDNNKNSDRDKDRDKDWGKETEEGKNKGKGGGDGDDIGGDGKRKDKNKEARESKNESNDKDEKRKTSDRKKQSGDYGINIPDWDEPPNLGEGEAPGKDRNDDQEGAGDSMGGSSDWTQDKNDEDKDKSKKDNNKNKNKNKKCNGKGKSKDKDHDKHKDKDKGEKICQTCPPPECPCEICSFCKRDLDVPDPPFMEDMKREEQKRQLRAYYRQMCHREYVRNRCREDLRAPLHKCDPICCDNSFCRNRRLAEHCDCLGAVQDLQKLLGHCQDACWDQKLVDRVEHLRQRICQRMCDCILT